MYFVEAYPQIAKIFSRIGTSINCGSSKTDTVSKIFPDNPTNQLQSNSDCFLLRCTEEYLCYVWVLTKLEMTSLLNNLLTNEHKAVSIFEYRFEFNDNDSVTMHVNTL